MLAALMGVGLGMIRDVLAGETPLALKEDFYDTATIVGAIIFFAMYRLSLATTTVTAAITLLLRLLAIQYSFQSQNYKAVHNANLKNE